MRRINKMLTKLGVPEKDRKDEETTFKYLCTVPGGWSNTARGMLLATVSADRKAEIMATHTKEKPEQN